MLTFLPLFILLAIVVVLQIITRSRLTLGNLWLIFILMIVLLWASMLILRTNLPEPIVISEWFPITTNFGSLVFQLDDQSWIVSFALISLLTGAAFVDTIRLRDKTKVREWSSVVLLVSLAVAGSMSNSILTFIITWTFLDIIDLVIFALKDKNESTKIQSLFILFSHLAGTLLILAAMVMGNSIERAIEIGNFQGASLNLLILGASLRMSFLPKRMTIGNQTSIRHTASKFTKFISPLLAMVFLSRLPVIESINGFLVFLYIFCVILVLYASINWYAVADPAEGNDFWVLISSGFILLSVLKGHPGNAVYWILLMVVVGGWAWLYSSRFSKMYYSLGLVVLGLIGLPFSLSVNTIAGIASGPFLIINPILWISIAFQTAGIIRASLKPIPQKIESENWMKMFYVFGITILSLAIWLPGIWQIGGLGKIDHLMTSVFICFVLSLILIFTYSKRAKNWMDAIVPVKTTQTFSNVGSLMYSVFQFTWIYRFSASVYLVLKRAINRFNTILEGEGGILWALVFLALLVSLLLNRSGG